ncbi:P-loop containing nucleoside triphosphate hydrolase protein, partial [Ascobolus immersus RN42]
MSDPPTPSRRSESAVPPEFDDYFGDEDAEEEEEFRRLEDELDKREEGETEEIETGGEGTGDEDEEVDPDEDDYVSNDASSESWIPISRMDLNTPRAIELKRTMLDDIQQATRRGPDFNPRRFQIDIATSVALGKDTLGISATGSGKSLTYELLAALPNSTHIIISPIRGLVEDQTRALRKHGLTAIGLTGDTIEAYGPSLWDDIANARYQYVVSSPEVLLNPESEFWKRMVRNRDTTPFLQRLRSITVDECHMVWKWGAVVDEKLKQSFRASFRLIGKMRLLFPYLPFLLLSATTSDAKKSLSFSDLSFLVSEPAKSGQVSGIKKTMVYTDERSKCQDIVKYLRSSFFRSFKERQDALRLDSDQQDNTPAQQEVLEGMPSRAELQHQLLNGITPYTGIYTATTNDKRLQDLKDDVCRILVCTEAAGMGLDIPDVEVVIQFRVGPNLTAADLWQRFGRCARDGRPGLCILFVDDVDTLILDPDDCVINGFDYSTPLTAETRAKVIDMLKRMYEEDNRTNGGPRKDPAIIWIINTTGCRKRLFYAIFKDPSAMDFSPASEFMCNCDNCMFPEKQAYDRLIPPKELCEYVSAGKRGERIAAKIAASVEHVHVIEKRREAAATQAIMGQQVVHGFELSKTLRFYDSAAKEQEQVQEELAKMAEKKTQNVKILADRIRMELVAEWASICERDDLEEEIGLLPCFSFPLDMVNRISLDRRSLEFAILDTDADKCLNAILGDSVELNATHIAPYAKELQAAVLRAKVHYESILATREALAMAQSRANSVARSAAGTPAPSRAASVDLGQQATQMDTPTPADTLNAPPRLQMPPDDKNYCPFCISKNHPNGYTPKKIIDLLSHFATPTHLKRVAATVNGGTGDPRFRYYQ